MCDLPLTLLIAAFPLGLLSLSNFLSWSRNHLCRIVSTFYCILVALLLSCLLFYLLTMAVSASGTSSLILLLLHFTQLYVQMYENIAVLWMINSK